MLEEVGAPYELRVLDLQAGDQLKPAFLAINPMGKVPTIEHDGAVITEVGAICTYLADAFPAAGLAPPVGDPMRGPYLRWMFFQGNCLEPAIVDHALKREPGRRGDDALRRLRNGGRSRREGDRERAVVSRRRAIPPPTSTSDRRSRGVYSSSFCRSGIPSSATSPASPSAPPGNAPSPSTKIPAESLRPSRRSAAANGSAIPCGV